MGKEHCLAEEFPAVWSDLSSERPAERLRSLLLMAEKYVLCADSRTLQDLSRKSHFHDNGFLKLTLFETSDQAFRIRLHVWKNGAEDVNIHNHRYDFASLVVSGVIENRRWRLSEAGKMIKVFQYSSRDENGEYRLARRGQAYLTPCEPEMYAKGDWYRMGHDDLHTAKAVVNGPVVTMCLQDRRMLKPHAWTYSTHHPDDAERIDAPALSLDQYCTAVRQALSLET